MATLIWLLSGVSHYVHKREFAANLRPVEHAAFFALCVVAWPVLLFLKLKKG